MSGVAEEHARPQTGMLYPDFFGRAELDLRVVLDLAEDLGVDSGDVAEALPDACRAALHRIVERLG